MHEASELDQAHDLQARIVDLGTAGDYRALLDLDEDAATGALLQLLPDAARERAELQLREARRWEEAQRQKNARRLDEAKRALDELDVGLAKGLLIKIDDRFLDDTDASRRDELLLEVSARSMELDEMNAVADRTVAELRPPKRRWWKRR